MNEINKGWLIEKKACASGVKWFLAQDETNTAKVMIKLVEEDRFSDALWVFENLSDKAQAVELAIFCAELVISVFEEKFPDDDRPRMAIEAAKKYQEDPTYAAADAAYVAADKKEVRLKIITEAIEILGLDRIIP